MNENSSAFDEDRAQSMLDACIRIISCFSIKANEYYNDINYLTDGEFSKSHLKKMIEEQQETLHIDLLKTDIPNLSEYSSLLDFKV